MIINVARIRDSIVPCFISHVDKHTMTDDKIRPCTARDVLLAL